jgi:glutaminyl-peptide cyclotransferase
VLEQMDALVLLDLLGSADPTISSFYPTTGWMFDQLRDIERRLGAAGRFAKLGEASWTNDQKAGLGRSWFRKRDAGRTWIGGGISDDHLPFLQRGVEILHGLSLRTHAAS